MHEQALSEIEFPRYARWLQRMAGKPLPLALIATNGDCIWQDDAGLAEACRDQVQNQGFDWPYTGCGMHSRACGEQGTLFYMPLLARGGQLLGLLVTMVAADVAPPWLDDLAEIMEDLVAAVADDFHLKTELNTMALELSERYEELHLVYAIDEKVRSVRNGEDIFIQLLKSCVSHTNVDVAAFIKPAENLCVSTANLSKPIHNLDLVLVEMRGDLFRFVNASRGPLVLNDIADPKRAYIFTDMPFKVLCCPVFENSDVVAILVLLNHIDKPNFTNSDRRLGEILANQLSSMSRIYSMLNETGKFNEQMAAALIETVEAKDPYTRGHSERVHHISMEIGRAMRLPDSEIDNLFWGSLLHDVGKIGIPDAVLCKPSRLTKDEYTFIMVHPERSYEILRHIDRFKGAVPGARHHQEKFDGTGYPHGLRGSEIPMNARIIAVADTYDSITSSRAYRAGRTHETAMAEIERVAGIQLDPYVIEIFKKMCSTEPEWLQRFNIRRDPVLQTV